eukprot:TRINITY_DN4069_c0_g2_i2.p1 TRINITY_DN4069_c0_g2~~TRINITY_DN4069_c0_g2_i2.p1  ORF type:complete len:151 (-),score=28.81 TRINITY_DN4069_c0_g2_i2:34-486(-)
MIFLTLLESIETLLAFQKKLRSNIEEKGMEYEMEYVIALVNNCKKCYDYTLELEGRMEPLEEKYKTQLNQFDEVKEGFQNLIKLCRKVLADQIFQDLIEEFKKFYTKEWYTSNGAIMATVKDTLNDYFINNIKGHMIESYFRKFLSLIHI